MNLTNRALLKLRSLMERSGITLGIYQTILLLKSLWVLA